MAIVVWDESMAIGNKDIDAQHAHLFICINNMQEKMLKSRDRHALIDALDSADSYIRYHFATEEKLMEQHGYPEFKAHKAMHQAFVDKITEMGKMVLAAEDQLRDPAGELLGYLLGWLSTHVLVKDKALGEFFARKGVI
ncbi:MAG: hypothetical protein D6E12_07805 [Desulfovibrio sp.]|nr:MAG: hypothetical protein D6E12_07805 [Desulfovibrio sp.]